MKKFLIISIIIIIAIISGNVIFFSSNKKQEIKNVSQCQTKEMIFYYSDECQWCQKVKNEGTIEKIKELGVNVKEINIAIGPIKHQFQGIPTFVIDNKVYSGYKTFEELKELLGCLLEKNEFSQNGNQNQQNQTSLKQTNNFIQNNNNNLLNQKFFGDKGQNVIFENKEIKLDKSIFNDNQARFYNVALPDSKIIYFFVVKDKNGIYRAAANACAVCFKTYKGFRQEGNEIVCNNCGNRYPIEKIATEKGGCNPGPINPNLEVKNNQIIIEQADIEKVSELF